MIGTVMSDKKVSMLPPLILHPFSDPEGPAKLVESSRASMMLQGLLPAGSMSQDELDQTLLNGRFCEIRMLYYVGKDLVRWIEQCMEHVERDPGMQSLNYRFQSFAAYLVEDAPEPVRTKLKKWGVADYKSIFARALGLNAVFGEAPDQTVLAPDFIRNYYRFADQMYAVQQHHSAFARVPVSDFDFELFRSEEHTSELQSPC